MPRASSHSSAGTASRAGPSSQTREGRRPGRPSGSPAALTQNTGASISRSRKVPPPTPVIGREEAEGDDVVLAAGGGQRAGRAEHGDGGVVQPE